MKYKLRFIDSFIGTLMVFLLMLIVPELFKGDFFSPLRNSFADFQITDVNLNEIRDKEVIQADTNIIIIDINGIRNLELSKVINIINENGAKIIALENLINFEDTEDDLYLIFSLQKVENLVLSYNILDFNKRTLWFKKADFGVKVNSEPVTSIDNVIINNQISYSYFLPQTININNDFFNSSVNNQNKIYVGYNNLTYGYDKRITTIRKFVPEIKMNDKTYSSFPLTITSLFDPEATENFLRHTKFMETINYRSNFEKFFFMNWVDVIEENVEMKTFKGKIVLLGRANMMDGTHILNDMYFTPLNEQESGKAFPDMFGVVIHANIISMILNGTNFNTMPNWIGVLIAILSVYVNFLLFFWVSDKYKELYEIISILAFLVQSLAILLITYYFYHWFNAEVELSLTLLAIAITLFSFELYKDSVKPLSMQFYDKIKKKIKRAKRKKRNEKKEKK